jgi:DNA topoisomerase VI subunit B
VDKWPCPGRQLDVTQDIVYAMASRGRSASFLDPAGEWQIATDLKHLVFPTEILVTAQRPDIVVWSRLLKHIILIELAVPWEENIEASQKRKLDRYNELVA